MRVSPQFFGNSSLVFWQMWMSVESRAPAASRTAPTTLEVMNATALQDTDSTQMAVAVMVRSVWVRPCNTLTQPCTLLFESSCNTSQSVWVCVVSVFRCRWVSGWEWQLWSHMPEQRRLLSVFLPPRFPPGGGPAVLHPWVLAVALRTADMRDSH